MASDTQTKLALVGKWAGSITAILALIAIIVGGIAKANTLVTSIEANSLAIKEMRAENANAAIHANEDLTRVVTAIKDRAEQDREILTQLRIAVAALGAVNSVRSGAPSSLRMFSTDGDGVADTSVPVVVGPGGNIILPTQNSALRTTAQIALDRAATLSVARDPLLNMN